MLWSYDKPGEEEPDFDRIAVEINGYNVAAKEALASFALLKDDGSTACGNWIYGGYWLVDKEAKAPAAKRRVREDKSGLGLYPRWSFSWPANRRIVYNRCSCDPTGKPWNPQAALAEWDGSRWITNDVPDFGIKDLKTGDPVPPEKTAAAPFLMLPEGQGRLFAFTVGDGPFPEHYEPVESPVNNILSKQQNNPLAVRFNGSSAKLAETGNPGYPYVATTHRMIEHYQSGAVTRNCPWLAEIAPHMFVSISPKLAQKLNIKTGDKVLVESARGRITCRASVLPVVKPLFVDGKEIEIVGMPWHWGYQALVTGPSANELTPSVGDPLTSIPEYKAFLVNVRKA